MRQQIHTRADHLRAMRDMGMAYYSHPGSGYAHTATGPSFHDDVRLAGPEDFAAPEVLAAAAPDRIFSLDVELPGYSLSD